MRMEAFPVDKKMICGVLLTVIGLVFSAFCFIWAVAHPCIYNGIGGLVGALLYAGILIPFLLALAVMGAGVILCFILAFRKSE